MAMMLSASWVAAAATHGAGSTSRSVNGSVPVANAPCGSAAHRKEATAAFRISDLKQRRIDWSIARDRSADWTAAELSAQRTFSVVPANAGTHNHPVSW